MVVVFNNRQISIMDVVVPKYSDIGVIKSLGEGVPATGAGTTTTGDFDFHHFRVMEWSGMSRGEIRGR